MIDRGPFMTLVTITLIMRIVKVLEGSMAHLSSNVQLFAKFYLAQTCRDSVGKASMALFCPGRRFVRRIRDFMSNLVAKRTSSGCNFTSNEREQAADRPGDCARAIEAACRLHSFAAQ
jgi:hypothetical protein